MRNSDNEYRHYNFETILPANPIRVTRLGLWLVAQHDGVPEDVHGLLVLSHGLGQHGLAGPAARASGVNVLSLFEGGVGEGRLTVGRRRRRN